MMGTRRLACPSCGVTLRLADSLPAGKSIKCPKCSEGIRIPPDTPPGGTAVRARKAPPRQVDDEPDESEFERPVKRKKLRKKKGSSIAPLLIGLAVGGVLLLGGGTALAVALWLTAKKPEPVAEKSPSRKTAPTVTEAAAEPPPQAEVQPEVRPRPTDPPTSRDEDAAPPREERRPDPSPRPDPPPSTERKESGGDSQNLALGMRVFTQACARCHSVTGGGGPGGVARRGRGPDLSRAGRNPAHTADWFVQFIRNPRSVKPNSRMPAFEGRLGDADMRAVAEYLVSLK